MSSIFFVKIYENFVKILKKFSWKKCKNFHNLWKKFSWLLKNVSEAMKQFSEKKQKKNKKTFLTNCAKSVDNTSRFGIIKM